MCRKPGQDQDQAEEVSCCCHLASGTLSIDRERGLDEKSVSGRRTPLVARTASLLGAVPTADRQRAHFQNKEKEVAAVLVLTIQEHGAEHMWEQTIVVPIPPDIEETVESAVLKMHECVPERIMKQTTDVPFLQTQETTEVAVLQIHERAAALLLLFCCCCCCSMCCSAATGWVLPTAFEVLQQHT